MIGLNVGAETFPDSLHEHIARKDERIERLEKLVAAFKQAVFGGRSEKPIPISSVWRWKAWKRS
jgi:hypothetical protein